MCCAKKDEWEVWMADSGALQSRVVKKCGRLGAGVRRAKGGNVEIGL